MQGSPQKGDYNGKQSGVFLKYQKISAFFVPHQRETSKSGVVHQAKQAWGEP